MHDFFTPWAVVTCLLATGVCFAAIYVMSYEDRTAKTTRWSKPLNWLGAHMGAFIILTSSATVVVWFLEHGHPLTEAGPAILVPLLYVFSGIFWNWVRRHKNERAANPKPRGS